MRVGPGGAFTGVDVNPAMIAVAQAVTPDVRLPIAWLTGDAHSLPFVDGSFHAGLCQFSLMFFSDRHAALLEMRRVVATGGRVALAVRTIVEAAGFRDVRMDIGTRTIRFLSVREVVVWQALASPLADPIGALDAPALDRFVASLADLVEPYTYDDSVACPSEAYIVTARRWCEFR